MTPQNLLIIMSDEHNPKVMGCAGHADIQTPNLDALAARGTRFTRAYCSSPICVPARAAMMTGRPVYETGYWDNVDAWDGKVRGWSHRLSEAGHEVSSIGKLHFRGWKGDDYGFSETLLPMHIHEGRGMTRMLFRNPPLPNTGSGGGMLNSAMAGQSDYNRYDESIVAKAKEWLTARAAKPSPQPAKPWALMVSMVAPHFPLTVPEPYYSMYSSLPLPMPKEYVFGIHDGMHPFIQDYARQSKYNLPFKSEADVRRALSGYYGLVSFLDHQVGELVRTLESTGLAGNTRIVYLSDHGDNTGARGLWGKSTMYEESAGIPLILAGDGVPKGQVVSEPASHLDLYASVLDAMGLPVRASSAEPHLATHSLSWFKIAEYGSQSGSQSKAPANRDAGERMDARIGERMVLSEYHTVGSRAALFMLTDRRHKYIHYCGLPPQLFDLQNDPEELRDLLAQPVLGEATVATARRFSDALLARMDPDDVDRRAKARQAELIELFGGIEAIRTNTGAGGFTPVPLA